MEILPIAQVHIEGFHRAVDIVARERKYLAFLEAPPLNKARQFVMENITRGHPQFVGLIDGDVVGWCDIIPVDRPVHAHVGVLGIGVLPSFRGQGVGRTLIETTMQNANQIGLTRIELSVHADNTRAIAFYQKIGFVREGVARDAILIDGYYQDSILMAIIKQNRL
jgi:RimJ/RimL family protein N-acetyltransferase